MEPIVFKRRTTIAAGAAGSSPKFSIFRGNPRSSIALRAAEIPRFGLIDSNYFCRRVEGMAAEQVLTAPQSPWQNPYAERLVGSLRPECLKHVIVLGEMHLRRILKSYFAYYHGARTHLSLGKDAPEPRAVHPTSRGKIVEPPEVGGLHHRYIRKAA